MNVQRGFEPEPGFQSAASLVSKPPMGVCRLMAVTCLTAALAVTALVGAANLGWVPAVQDDGALSGDQAMAD